MQHVETERRTSSVSARRALRKKSFDDGDHTMRLSKVGDVPSFAGSTSSDVEQGTSPRGGPTNEHALASEPSLLSVGDSVQWRGFDDDIPIGTFGRVTKVFGDGDVEAEFPDQTGGSQLIFTFSEKRLKRAAPKESIPKRSGSLALQKQGETSAELLARAYRAQLNI